MLPFQAHKQACDLIVLTCILMVGLGIPAIARLEKSGNHLPQKECDGRPMTRRVLTATQRVQRKDILLTRSNGLINYYAHNVSSGHDMSCDVWKVKSLTPGKWIEVLVLHLSLWGNDTFYLITANEDKETKVLQLHSQWHSHEKFDSFETVTLLWIRRDLPTPKSKEERELSFSFSMNKYGPAGKRWVNEETQVIVGACVLVTVTIVATVVSLARAKGWQRTLLFYLRRGEYRRPYEGTREGGSTPGHPINSLSPLSSSLASTPSSFLATVPASSNPRRSQTIMMLMEMEVLRPPSGNERNADGSGCEMEHALYTGLLPPRYEDVVQSTQLISRHEYQQQCNLQQPTQQQTSASTSPGPLIQPQLPQHRLREHHDNSVEQQIQLRNDNQHQRYPCPHQHRQQNSHNLTHHQHQQQQLQHLLESNIEEEENNDDDVDEYNDDNDNNEEEGYQEEGLSSFHHHQHIQHHQPQQPQDQGPNLRRESSASTSATGRGEDTQPRTQTPPPAYEDTPPPQYNSLFTFPS